MKKFETQLILLSDQVLPNVIPAIDKNIMPDKIILCESDAMRNKGKADILKDFFKTKGIETQYISLGSAYDFEELQKIFETIANTYSSEELAINLTGGTKMMSIAAQNIFTMYGNYTCFYVVPNQDKIIVFNTGAENTSEYILKDQIKLNDYFKIHGYKVISKNTVKNFNMNNNSSKLPEKLLQNLNLYRNSISKLNGIAADAEKKFPLKVKATVLPDDEPLFHLFYEHKYITYTDTEVQFKNEAARRFCNGIWLEEYIFNQLKLLKDQLQDFATSVEIESREGTRNEFDAAFLYKNNLYIIEAKTSQIDDKGNDIIYKLDSLKAKTGLYTKPIIVSLKNFNHIQKARAQQYGIQIVESSNINRLNEKIKKIIN